MLISYALLKDFAVQAEAQNQTETDSYRRIRVTDLFYSVIAKSDRYVINCPGFIYQALPTEHKRQIFDRHPAEYQAWAREKFSDLVEHITKLKKVKKTVRTILRDLRLVRR